ncbi:protein male-specific lethal-1 isoform X1 [Danaus plexippus]|uniref:protein male-specific lethal-1 isoform X1 n=1 Tax=Danaus plexippus TaxID=13037 RepID=UPI002AB2C2D1|nr:protein male-specific lethal-1 isoform X1 [Danaus plexippus]
MNSRNSVNETNLVNFSAELPRLPQLDAKDGLLSFPFDHIYACHSQSSDRRQDLQLEKEVEVSTHCVVGDEKNISGAVPDISRLSEQLNVTESQNKKLKELLIYHLDLIQQQNELITKRDKLYQALKQENDTLKSKLIRMDRKGLLQQQQFMNSILSPPNATVTSSILKKEHGLPQIMLNSFTELLLPDKGNSFHFDNNKTFGQDTPLSFGIARTTIDPAELPEEPKFMSSDLKTPALNRDYKMIDNKRSLVKKETKSRSDALYTVTSNSGNTIIQRIQRKRRRTSGIGSLSRMTKTPKANIPETVTSNKTKPTEPEQSLGRTYSVNKKSKPLNTYGKSRSTTIPKKTVQYTGSLSDRLQLIDTTPTGEDPYQLGEADMREQSPIPKLMLQKTNHGRMKVLESVGESTRRIYDRPTTKNKNLNRFMSTYDQDKKEEDNTSPMLLDEPDIELIKTEPDIDWRMYTENLGNDSSLCDFSFGESSNQMLPSLDATEFQELFSSDAALNLDNLNQLDYPTEKVVPEKTKKRGARTSSLVVPGEEEAVESKRGSDSRRGRKRALSATGLGKQPQKTATKPKASKGKAAARGKKSPVPSLMTDKPYHTLVCDPDLSWYLGLDQDLKFEDVDPPADTQASTVEVPRWREKPYTSSYVLEGTENVDDKVFEKRHQKLEAEERRQLRWHMRRIREQRHVERLRQRQRDSWNSTVSAPSVYTVWPRPQDARFIEITDDLPVTGFGEPMPQLPQSDFMLPWVRTSKALKRSKRSKTHS